jgi:hypothetical protein
MASNHTPKKIELETLAKKYKVRYIGQTKRKIVDSLIGLRRRYMTIKERKQIYPLAKVNKKKLLRQTMNKRSRQMP